MKTLRAKFYSLVVSNGDGSASVLYFADKSIAWKAYQAEEDFGENFCDAEPTEEYLEFDENGKLLNPDEPYDYSEDEE